MIPAAPRSDVRGGVASQEKSPPMPATLIRHRARRPQIEAHTPLIPIAVARQVVDEVSLFLGVPLSGRYAAGLAFRARRIFAHSESFREKMQRPGNRGRDLLYVFMRHWLGARLRAEHPELFNRLPSRFCEGEPLPTDGRARDDCATDLPLSNEARMIWIA